MLQIDPFRVKTNKTKQEGLVERASRPPQIVQRPPNRVLLNPVGKTVDSYTKPSFIFHPYPPLSFPQWCCGKVSVKRILLYGRLKELDKKEKSILPAVFALTEHQCYVATCFRFSRLSLNVIRGLKQRGKKKSWRGSERKERGQIVACGRDERLTEWVEG